MPSPNWLVCRTTESACNWVSTCAPFTKYAMESTGLCFVGISSLTVSSEPDLTKAPAVGKLNLSFVLFFCVLQELKRKKASTVYSRDCFIIINDSWLYKLNDFLCKFDLFTKKEPMSVLTISNIHKSFGRTIALNGVSFDVPRGSIFGILGPNGSGKTTLLSILLGVLEADQGSYAWENSSATENVRKNMGSFLETPNFYHYLSAWKNLELVHLISGRGSRAEIDGVLQKVGLFERRHSAYSTFSLGMKQRLAIGATLLGAPPIIVLDEPTNGLDPNGILEVRRLILRLKDEGHTIIMASHLLDEVEKTCTHVAILKNGQLVAADRVDHVLGAADNQVELSAANLDQLKLVLKEYPSFNALSQEKDILLVSLSGDQVDLADLNAYCFSRGIHLSRLALRRQKLESKFFELTEYKS